MSRKYLVFDSFGAGEFGRVGAAKAPPDSFTATNMLVNAAGELVVRPGLKNITPSGTANGLVHAFGNTPVPFADLFYVQGTSVRTFSTAGDNLQTSGTTLAETPARAMDWFLDTTSILLASPEDKIYRLTPDGSNPPAVAALTGSPGAESIVRYGDRIVAAKIDGSFIYRLRFSDAADPDSWPDANFIDIGDGWHISGLYAQRQHLLITKQVGFYVLTGVPGVNPVVRKVSSQAGPLYPLAARLGNQDLLWYQDLSSKFPSTFNGSQHVRFSHLEYASSTPGNGSTLPLEHGVAKIDESSEGAIFVADSGNKAAIYFNGVWTFHTFGVDVSGFVAPGGSEAHFCDGGAADASPKFYTLNINVDSPGIEGSVGKAGDDTDVALSGSVTFPEWWSETMAEVYVRAVIVDFKTWDTGATNNNHFDLTVKALRRYQAGGAQDSSTVSFDEAPGSSSSTGTLQRRIFGFGEQGKGNGFQLEFENCRGMAIQRIQVVTDSEPVRI